MVQQTTTDGAHAMPVSVRSLVVLLGLITATPVLSLGGAGALEVLYGVVELDPAGEVLVAHRGVLQLVLGAAIVGAAFRRRWLVPVALAAAVTKGSYVALVLAAADARQQIGLTSVLFDVVAIVLLLAVAARWRL